MIIDEYHPTIVDRYKVRKEVMGDRPLSMNNRHRGWGYHAPATDLDFLEYNGLTCDPVALIELKHKPWKRNLTSSPIRAQAKLATLAGLPMFVVEWQDDFKWFTLLPINPIARTCLAPGADGMVLTERQYIEFLYTLREGEQCTLTDRAYELLRECANELSPWPPVPKLPSLV